jgi:hypothetical protein
MTTPAKTPTYFLRANPSDQAAMAIIETAIGPFAPRSAGIRAALHALARTVQETGSIPAGIITGWLFDGSAT